jgi:hypothetical protein
MPGGPPPKPDSQRRRRNAVVPMVQLPLGGRRGPVPPWPEGVEEPADLRLWAELWATPMAAAWERFGYHRQVARLCLLLPKAESGKFAAQLFAEVRQLEDRLGLNPLALMRLRWEVPADELGERRSRPASSRAEAVDLDAVARAD